MRVIAHCPKCDAGLPVSAAEAPESIKCGGCGHVLSLVFSDALRSDARVDVCPVCRGGDFYIRKDFDPKVGLTVVIIGALDQRRLLLVRGRSDRLQHPRRRRADRPVRLRPPGRCHRLLSMPQRVPRKVPAHRLPLRSAHGRRPRAGIRAKNRPPVALRSRRIAKRLRTSMAPYGTCHAAVHQCGGILMWNKDEVKGKTEEVEGNAKQAVGDADRQRGFRGRRRSSGSRRQGSGWFRQGTP